MKLTESHLRQMIRQELKKAMGLNEAAEEATQRIDVKKLIQALTTAGDSHHAEDLKRYINSMMFVYPQRDQMKPEMTVYQKDNAGNISPYNSFPTKLILQAVVRY
jgi:hypothetical protein